MKINDAVICLDCDEVFVPTDGFCPACGDCAPIALANWLQPLPTKDEIEREMRSQALLMPADYMLLRAKNMILFNDDPEPLGVC